MKESTRTQRLADQITKLLDGATTHPEIRSQLPKLETFFNKLSSIDFIALLSSDISKPVHAALWYHYGATMHKAVDKCAIATQERMIELYPLWRQFADESDNYFPRRVGRPKNYELTHIVIENSLPKLLQAVCEHEDCPEWIASSIKSHEQQKKINNAVLDLSNFVTEEEECLDLAKNLLLVLNDPRTPSKLFDAISDGLGKENEPLDIIDSPEYIAKVLCQEVVK